MNGDRMDPRTSAAIRSRLLREVEADRARATRRARPARAHRSERHRLLPVLTTAVVAAVVVAASATVLVQVHRPEAGAPLTGSDRMFGGRCAALVPDAAVRRAVGSEVDRPSDTTESGAVEVGAPTASLYALRGLRCDWTAVGGGKGDEAGLVLAAAPLALAPRRAAAVRCYSSSEGGPAQATCTVDVRAGRVWYTGLLTVSRGSERTARVRVADLRAVLADAARKPGAAVDLPPRSAGSRTVRVDCAALVRDARLASALGVPGLRGEPGNGPGEQPAAQSAADRRAGATGCIAESADGGGELAFEIRPEAAPVRSLLTEDPTAVTTRLDGDVPVVTTRASDGSKLLHVFDGADYLQIDPEQVPVRRIRAALPTLLRALDARRR